MTRYLIGWRPNAVSEPDSTALAGYKLGGMEWRTLGESPLGTTTIPQRTLGLDSSLTSIQLLQTPEPVYLTKPGTAEEPCGGELSYMQPSTLPGALSLSWEVRREFASDRHAALWLLRTQRRHPQTAPEVDNDSDSRPVPSHALVTLALHIIPSASEGESIVRLYGYNALLSVVGYEWPGQGCAVVTTYRAQVPRLVELAAITGTRNEAGLIELTGSGVNRDYALAS